MDREQAINIVDALYGRHQIIGFRRGVSDTIVVVITDGKDKFVLKMGVKANLRNTIEEESLRRKILLPYFEGHLPEILSYQIHSGIEVMKMQHVGDYNFHEVVMSGLKPSTTGLEILSQILSVKKKLWLSTSKSYAVTDCLRDYQKRADEIADRVEGLMLRGQRASDFLDLPVVINILVSENDWFIVDWEWTGRHDWIESLSRMYGWWQMMGTTLQDMPKIAITKYCFQFEYALGFSSLVSELMTQTQKMGRSVADDLNEVEFQEKLNYMLATYYLRDLNFQLQRGRQDFIVPAIGEAFRAMFPQY